MTAAVTLSSTRTAASYRWSAMAGVVVVVAMYVGLRPLMPSEYARTALNDIAWWLVALLAAVLCWRTATVIAGRERVSWRLLAAGCASWFVGQTVWNYFEIWQGQLPSFPHWMQLFFNSYEWIFIGGLLCLPRPDESRQLTPRHVGNLFLIVCALSVALIIALLEPALMPSRNEGSNLVVAAHCLGLAALFVTALYLLWSHRWRGLYWPLVFVLFGAGLHTATYIAYVHDVMTGSYVAGMWLNVTWLFVFGAYAAAAHERAWQAKYGVDAAAERISRRERILEALIPALLIGVTLSVAYSYRMWITERSTFVLLAPAFGFAIVLGLREAWIQRQEQRLLKTLGDANAAAQGANRELQQSETRYRALNAELEQRVGERTNELEQAYRELENFSYAVAHDLKAPLRAVDGFGAMLAHDYADRLDETGRHYVQRMRTSALRMSTLIDDLLSYARVDHREFNLRALPLGALVHRVVQEQEHELAQYNVAVHIDVADVTVRADEAGLLLALRNLLQNALKFSKQAKPPKISICSRLQDATAILSIHDNGIGFDMTYHDRIFEMFQRLHRADEIPGTGIGLAIVRKAIERMGGKVWADSKPGEGATFYLQLQVAK